MWKGVEQDEWSFYCRVFITSPIFYDRASFNEPVTGAAQSLLHIDSTRAFDGSGANDVREGTSTSEDGRK